MSDLPPPEFVIAYATIACVVLLAFWAYTEITSGWVLWANALGVAAAWPVLLIAAVVVSARSLWSRVRKCPVAAPVRAHREAARLVAAAKSLIDRAARETPKSKERDDALKQIVSAVVVLEEATKFRAEDFLVRRANCTCGLHR